MTGLNRRNFAEFFRTDYYMIQVKFIVQPEIVDSSLAYGPKGANNAERSDRKLYTYKVPKNIELDIGDKVVVCTDDPELATALKICTVFRTNIDADLDQDSFKYKWIVGKFNDVLGTYKENIAKDEKLLKAVAKLERAMERVSLQEKMKLAIESLPESDRKELADAFGVQNLLGSDGDGEAKDEAAEGPGKSRPEPSVG